MLFYLSIKSNFNTVRMPCNPKLVIVLVRNHVLLVHFLVPKLLFLRVKSKKFSGGLRPPSPPPGALPLNPAGGCAPRPLLELTRRRVAPPRSHGTQPARFARCQDRKPQSKLYHRAVWHDENLTIFFTVLQILCFC